LKGGDAVVQMKKACITRREEQMRELSQKGDLPVALLPQLNKGGGSSGGLPKPRVQQDFRYD